MKYFILSFLISVPAFANHIACGYELYGMNVGSIEIEMRDQQPASFASVTLFKTPTRQLSLTVNTPQMGESYNFSLAKEDPNNHIDMIVYTSDPNGLVKSKIINHAAPLGKELQGACD